MADKAMQDDVGNDLLSAWWDETYKSEGRVFLNDDGSSVLTRIADEIKKAVAGLATLETAARIAAHDVHLRRGAPEGIGVLPPEYVIALAEVIKYMRKQLRKNPKRGRPFPFDD